MIKVVLFDYGGVLTEGGRPGVIARTIAKTYGVPVEKVDPSKLTEVISKTTRGLPGGSVDFFTDLDKYFRITPSDWQQRQAQYLAAADIFVRCEPVYQLAERLRRRGIATGIFSDMMDFVADELEKRGFYDGFDPLLLSCREHTDKFRDDFYELAIQRSRVRPDEILLIDDRDRWRPAAERTGMQFLLATSPQQIVRDTTRLVERQNGVKLQ